MHDIMLAKEILDEVLKQSKKNKFKKISKVVVSLGQFIEHDEEILPENLRENFQLLAKNTLAADAELIIKKINQPKVWQLKEIEGKRK